MNKLILEGRHRDNNGKETEEYLTLQFEYEKERRKG